MHRDGLNRIVLVGIALLIGAGLFGWAGEARGQNPPSHFALVSPRHNSVVESRPGHGFPPEGFMDSLLFVWARSVDLDSGADLKYQINAKAFYWHGRPHGRLDSLCVDREVADTFLWVNVDGIVDSMAVGTFYPCLWSVKAVSQEDTTECDSTFTFQFFWEVSVEGEGRNLPTSVVFYPPHPNPFNSTTTIRYGLGKPGRARIVIYDVTGKPVAVLQDGMMEAGWHEAVWKAEGLGAGVYFVRLEAGGKNEVRKVVMVR